MTDGVALAHDYVTQRGGAERVALLLADAFPGSPLYTTLYEPSSTFPEFARLDVRASHLNRVRALRRYHRLALPLLAPAVDAHRVEAEVLLASSTGWAHGFRGARRTVVYCHAPARWLYQPERYLTVDVGAARGDRVRAGLGRAAVAAAGPALRAWDARAARRADRYVVNSTATQRAVREAYGIRAEVVPPPPALLPGGAASAVAGVEPGYVLCVARLLPYKNVDAAIHAVTLLGDARLVIVGDGPDRGRLQRLADAAGVATGSAEPRVRLVGRVDDAELRWLYQNASALVAASYEDYGLSPLEAGAFGVPSVVLRDGGYLDTVVEAVNGVFFDAPEPGEIARALEAAAARAWDPALLAAHVESFRVERFVARIRAIVEAERDDRRDEGRGVGFAEGGRA